MNIKIKYTNQNNPKIWRNLLKYWQKYVILGQFLAFVTLNLTFKRIFYPYCYYFSTNVVLCNIFLWEKVNYNLNKEIA